MSPPASIQIGSGRDNPVGLALLTLAQEMWVMKDRQMVVEALLHDKGLLGEVENYQPSPELSNQIEQERARFVNAITAVLITGKPVT